jgi:low affinity Fe/Cu permease
VQRANKGALRRLHAMNELFRHFAQKVSRVAGSAWAFLGALGVTIAWGLSGSLFGYSDTWQLVINTGTTIVTFLMVFLIQNTQNRDAKALHLKLDELLRAVTEARTRLVSLEDLPDAELDRLHDEFQRLKGASATAGMVAKQPPRLRGSQRSPD